LGKAVPGGSFFLFILFIHLHPSISRDYFMDKDVLRIRLEDPLVFKQFFETYHRKLTLLAFEYVQDMDVSKEIIQCLFVRFWENRHSLNIRPAATAYLYQCVKNACINNLHKASRFMPILDEDTFVIPDDDVLEKLIAVETEERMFRMLDKMPEKCRQIFRMSRVEGLRHAEIADKLGLSIKTIEKQIGIALKKLVTLRMLILMVVLFFLS
jgi:RNA polymerase sigma-70 factor, ECF subfamily